MRFRIHSHRNGQFLFENEPTFRDDWLSLREAIEGISDEDLIRAHTAAREKRTDCKSLSDAINALLRTRLDAARWKSESAIFSDSSYAKKDETRWRLDFASEVMAVEVAFNHGEAIAWNLLKPVLSAELNHVEKAVQTRAGVLITATEALRRAGNFDGSVGTYEKFLRYLNPMMNVLTVPMVIVGLEAPESFALGKQGSMRGAVIAKPSTNPAEQQTLLAAEEPVDFG